MPRQPRQFEIGGIYHIINRGVDKCLIYQKPQDYSRYILGLEFFNQEDSINLWPLLVSDWSTLEVTALVGSDPTSAFEVSASVAERIFEQREKMRKNPHPLVELLAFVLMPNHFHLIIREIKKGGISKFMQKMGGYSSYLNKQYGRVGPLFQSRFKDVLIRDERQLWNAFCYVHANPIELWEPGWKKFKIEDWRGAIKKLNEYKWSSYRDYIGMPTHTAVTQRDFLFEFFGGAKGCQSAAEDLVRKRFEVENFDPTLYE